MAFYNPISKARPHQLDDAFDLLRRHLPGTVPVIYGRAAGRPDEAIRIVPLSEARGEMADMATCVIVGTAETRLVEREGQRPIVYSPRYFKGGPDAAGPGAGGGV
jgi:precorrin-3B C17-methyltransferase